MSESAPLTQRIVSLDQFRGYTVVGMFLVNFVGGFEACHYVLRHYNTFCSYADTIMPQFFFAVGFAFRLTFLKRAQTQGLTAAYGRTVRRLLGLLLVSFVVYTIDGRPTPGDNAPGPRHLAGNPSSAETRLVPDANAYRRDLDLDPAGDSIRVGPTSAYMVGSAALHVALSYWFYFAWVNNGQPNVIDGGPLGF